MPMTCPICGESATFTKIESHLTDGYRYDVLRCSACDSHFADPLKEVANDWYEGRYQHRNYPWRWEFGVCIDEMPQLMPPRPDGTFSVMDVGCGNGEFLRGARARYPKSTLIGLDFNRWAIADLPRFDIKAYPKTLKSFAEDRPAPLDLITFFHLFEHLDDPGGFLRDARSLLAKDGRIFFSIPNRNRWNLPFFGYEVKDSPPHHLLRFTRQGLEKILARNGFVMEQYVPEPFRLNDLRSFLTWRLSDALRLGLAKRIGGSSEVAAPKSAVEMPRAVAPTAPAADSTRRRLVNALVNVKQRVVVPLLGFPYACWFYLRHWRQLKNAQGHALYIVARRVD